MQEMRKVWHIFLEYVSWFLPSWYTVHFRARLGSTKGQKISEWIYEVIVSPKIWTKNCKNFCPVVLHTAQYRAEILTIFGSYFGGNNDFIYSFWNLLTFRSSVLLTWFKVFLFPRSVPLMLSNLTNQNFFISMIHDFYFQRWK